MELVVVPQADRSGPTRLEKGVERNPRLFESLKEANPMDISRIKPPIGIAGDHAEIGELLHAAASDAQPNGQVLGR